MREVNISRVVSVRIDEETYKLIKKNGVNVVEAVAFFVSRLKRGERPL